MNRSSIQRSRAIIALLLFVLLLAPACDSTSGGEEEAANPNPNAKVSDEKRERIEEAAKGQPEPQENTNAEPETTPNVQASETRAPEAPSIHRATEENSSGDYTYLSDPGIDGDPNAVVFASPIESYDHNIGVWYEPEQQKWAIFNQDRAPVPTGAAFEVSVPEGSGGFVHRAALLNIVGNATYLDDPLTNGEPAAALSVTQNWNPGGGGGVYNDHPVGVLYDEDAGRWFVYNEDAARMPEGSAFNVAVSGQPNPQGSGPRDASPLG